MEIGSIVRGHANELFKLNQDISETRLQICEKCPLYKKNVLGGLCNPRLWLNPETMEVSNSRKDNFYKGCGCRLQAKTRDVKAHCTTKQW